MKFATSKAHRDFFLKQGWIEFEGLMAEDQLALFNQAVDQVLAERLKCTPQKLSTFSAGKKFFQGRDMWRSDPFLHKIACNVRFAEIAAELMELKTVRLGYDQLFPVPEKKVHLPEPSDVVYSNFLQKRASLESVSCIQGVLGGLIFALNGEKGESLQKEGREGQEPLENGIDIFPEQAGNAIFFQPTAQIDWSRLSVHADQRFYLIVYTSARSLYILQPEDPHTHALKHLGYVFNDKLSDKLHPLICR